MRTTKKKKSKQKQTRKKRGGAHGLQVEILYNTNNEIVDIRTNEILANKDYIKMNKIDPKYSFMDLMRDTFNFRDVIGNTHDFFHPFDPPRNNMKTRRVKIAINDKRDIQLIQITNKILNKNKNKRISHPFIVVRRNGRMTKESMADFAHEYKLLLRENEEKLLEDFEGNDKLFKVAKQMLRTPVLVNLISIKFGLLRKGDLKLGEIRQIFGGANDQLNDSLSELNETQKLRPTLSLYDIDEDDKKKAENKKIDAKIECEAKGTCPPEGESSALNPLAKPFPNIVDNTPEKPLPDPLGKTYVKPSATPLANPLTNPLANQSANNLLNIEEEQENEEQSEKDEKEEESSELQEPNNTPPTKTLSTREFNNIINDDKRLTALFTFNKMLGGLVPLSNEAKVKISNTKTKFYKDVKAGNKILDFELQKYLIENILAVIGIKDSDLFDTSQVDKDSFKYQAIVLTLIRILLTWNMRNWNEFRNSLNDSAQLSSSAEICKLFSDAFGMNLYTWSYHNIISNLQNENACNDYDKIITINLNKLYEMFTTKGLLYISSMVAKSVKDDDTTKKELKKYEKNPFDETYKPNNPIYIFKETI
jgi:hypothetical protein